MGEVKMSRCPPQCKQWQKHIKECISPVVKTVHKSPIDEIQDKLPTEIKDYVDVFIEYPIGQLPT